MATVGCGGHKEFSCLIKGEKLIAARLKEGADAELLTGMVRNTLSPLNQQHQHATFAQLRDINKRII